MIRFVDLYPNATTYTPGEDATLCAVLRNADQAPTRRRLSLTLTYLTETVETVTRELALEGNADETVRVRMPLPPQDARGYGVDAAVRDERGEVVCRRSTALDVLSRWTLAPRYGFFSDFPPDRSAADADASAAWLAKHHINGLQFYDWMYRHDTLLTEDEPYVDPLGRTLSRETITRLIEAAHEYKIAAMAYVAVYGASVAYWQSHPDGALYDRHGNPFPFGDDFLYIMNPAPTSSWTNHLLNECRQVVESTAFDGLHIDQYGWPKEGYDADGRAVDLPAAFRAFIDRVKEQLEAPTVFNAVDNWPIEALTQSQQDFNYIEVWPPRVRYYDFWEIVTTARRLNGRPVVIAAYISPARPHNVLLANATIFAGGGTHIELGEHGRMLADPYFPKHEAIDDDLAASLRRYYDFAVRYENLLMLETTDVTAAGAGRIAIDDVAVSRDGSRDTVWTIVREGEDCEVINLINLCGVESVSWTEGLADGPTALSDLSVHIEVEREVERVWLASPDGASPAPTYLAFETDDDTDRTYVSFTIPTLTYWDTVVLEYA